MCLDQLQLRKVADAQRLEPHTSGLAPKGCFGCKTAGWGIKKISAVSALCVDGSELGGFKSGKTGVWGLKAFNAWGGVEWGGNWARARPKYRQKFAAWQR